MKTIVLLLVGAVVTWVAWDSVAAWWTEPETYDPHWFDCLPADEFFRRVDHNGRFVH